MVAPINLTQILKNLPKTTGNGPFVSIPKFTKFNDNTISISIPANSIINKTNGKIISISTTSNDKNFENLSRSIQIRSNLQSPYQNSPSQVDSDCSQKIITQIPLSVIVNTPSWKNDKLITIQGTTNTKSGKALSTSPNNNQNQNKWEIFNPGAILTYQKESNDQINTNTLKLVVGYDSLVKVAHNELVFINEKFLIAMNTPLSGTAITNNNISFINPNFSQSIYLSNLSRKLYAFWNKKYSGKSIFPKLNISSFYDLFNEKDREVVYKYYSVVKNGLNKSARWLRNKTKRSQTSRNRLIKVTGPRTLLLKN